MTQRKRFFSSRDPKVVADRILDAAERTFREEGFAGASTNQILLYFGGSKATIFKHFPTKNDLLVGVIRRIGERLAAAAAWPDITETEACDWLVSFSRRALVMILHEDAIFVGKMVVAQGRNFPILRETFERCAVNPMRSILFDRFRIMADAGIIVSDNLEADVLLYSDMLLAGWLARSMYGHDVEVTEEFLSRESLRAARIFLNGVRPRVNTG